MYSVIASIKTTAPVQAIAATPSAEQGPRFPATEFLKMLGTALACGLTTGLLAAAVAMLLAQV